MTTNKPEVKRYSITTDKYYHPAPYESDIGRWVEYSSYKALQAECEKLREDAIATRDVAGLVMLLEHAQCPNCDGSGARYDSHGEPEQCQWCHERAEALAAHRKGGDQ